MRGHYGEMLRIETLAEIAGMSEASFHRHFKAATAMSPLQYQKSLRLQAARRLLATGSEANRAAFAVGYESASQFSREYRRAFGITPSRDRSEAHTSELKSLMSISYAVFCLTQKTIKNKNNIIN